MKPRLEALAVCAPGIEHLCLDELGALGIKTGKPFRGGVPFFPNTRQLYAANVWLRTATRVVLRIVRFDAHNWDEMTTALAAVEWDRWIRPDSAVRLRTSSKGSRLYHTGAIAERVVKLLPGTVTTAHEATDDGSGSSEASDDQLVIVRASHNRFTVSIDSSGASLHRRGWRQEVAKAPMRETLAAAVLLATPWDPTTPLIDPLCGSGTIAIEAALLAAGRPPGEGRSFAFSNWPEFAPGTWASVNAELAKDTPVAAVGPIRILGFDRDAGAVKAATNNARRAGVSDAVRFAESPVSDLVAPVGATAAGALVTNPPYGVRVGGADLRNLYSRLGDVARDQLADWRVGMLVADTALSHQTGLKLRERFVTHSGPIEVRCLAGVIRARTPPRQPRQRQPSSPE